MNSGHSPDTIMVVDDSPATVEVLQRNLTAAGFRVFTASGVSEALKLLDKATVDLVITDLKMPGVSGMDLVRHVRENLHNTEVMMITGYATVDGAVQAVKTGAEEFLAKPFTDEELLGAVKRALGKLRVRRAARDTALESNATYPGILGESEAMRRVLAAVARAATTSATVLIAGESGSLHQ